MPLILDASISLAWLFERENKSEAKKAEDVLLSIENDKTLVPTLWHTEVLNALVIGERRNVIKEAQILDYINRLYALPIETDNSSPYQIRNSILSIAREHKLTAYDATYLELTLRMGGILATFDKQLAQATQNAGGKLF